MAGGNSRSSTLGARADVKRLWERSTFTAGGALVRADANDPPRRAVGSSGDFEIESGPRGAEDRQVRRERRLRPHGERAVRVADGRRVRPRPVRRPGQPDPRPGRRSATSSPIGRASCSRRGWRRRWPTRARWWTRPGHQRRNSRGLAPERRARAHGPEPTTPGPRARPWKRTSRRRRPERPLRQRHGRFLSDRLAAAGRPAPALRPSAVAGRAPAVRRPGDPMRGLSVDRRGPTLSNDLHRVRRTEVDSTRPPRPRAARG